MCCRCISVHGSMTTFSKGSCRACMSNDVVTVPQQSHRHKCLVAFNTQQLIGSRSHRIPQPCTFQFWLHCCNQCHQPSWTPCRLQSWAHRQHLHTRRQYHKAKPCSNLQCNGCSSNLFQHNKGRIAMQHSTLVQQCIYSKASCSSDDWNCCRLQVLCCCWLIIQEAFILA